MEAYTGFAAVYDIFMDNVPYEEWSSYLHGLLLEHGIEEGIVLDLGCGFPLPSLYRLCKVLAAEQER